MRRTYKAEQAERFPPQGGYPAFIFDNVRAHENTRQLLAEFMQDHDLSTMLEFALQCAKEGMKLVEGIEKYQQQGGSSDEFVQKCFKHWMCPQKNLDEMRAYWEYFTDNVPDLIEVRDAYGAALAELDDAIGDL